MSLTGRIFTERRGVVLPVLLLLAVNIGVLLLGVLPMQTSVAGLETARDSSMLTLSQARNIERSAKSTLTSRQRADVELAKFYAEILPHDLVTATKTTNLWIQHAARDAGVTFTAAAFDYVPLRDSKLTRAFARVTLSGRYPNIKKFLYALETAEEFIVVEKVELTEPGGASTTQQGILEVSMTVATYYLTPPGAPSSASARTAAGAGVTPR
ncbi:MAG TPA: GspMb/PilO family protein [Vicinamibacterales bacterium]|nr:GspMb/PilO family protein [Vicinamibacterales bacterium]